MESTTVYLPSGPKGPVGNNKTSLLRILNRGVDSWTNNPIAISVNAEEAQLIADTVKDPKVQNIMRRAIDDWTKRYISISLDAGEVVTITKAVRGM